MQVIYGGFFDVEAQQKRILQFDEQMAESNFWDSPQEAKKIIAQVNQLKNSIAGVVDYNKRLSDAIAWMELAQESPDDESILLELDEGVKRLEAEIDNLEVASFLNGPHDASNAIISIHAGAGGTESCDWADMLFRLYSRWAERRGFKLEVEDIQSGDEAGISRVTFRVEGAYAYGYAKAERGVHRLVRISPFDSNKRRHTSFASVDVIAEIEDDVDFEINETELRIDTYRSSGKGGQHVNKTDSAVRITHLPTNIVVTCQVERSQLKNKERALKTLKSRLLEKMEDEKRSSMEKFYGEKGEMGWGNQIRSYVLQPYQLVKDLRTDVETGNVQAVLDGDIDFFINAWLKNQK